MAIWTYPEGKWLVNSPLQSCHDSAGVAVLFAGSWRYEERTLASLARHMVRPLSATVLCALSGGGGSGWRERQRMKKFFPALAGENWGFLRWGVQLKSLLRVQWYDGMTMVEPW